VADDVDMHCHVKLLLYCCKLFLKTHKEELSFCVFLVLFCFGLHCQHNNCKLAWPLLRGCTIYVIKKCLL